MDKRIENLNVLSEDSLLTPMQLKQKYPLSEKAVATVKQSQETVWNILNRKDHRLFVVVGPCSVHDVKAAEEYAARLNELSSKVGDTLFIIMRVYFEKPRTKVGWQGLINDPHLDNSFAIEDGLKLARTLLLNIAKMGVPAAGETLDLVTPQYVQDLFCWTAIGARTTESQSHRKMASGLTSAVGFKNGTDGNLQVAVNAMLAAAHGNHFLSVEPEGRVAVIRTKGNPNTHVVLRGGSDKPNYDKENISACEALLKKANMPLNIMVDCSHANSGKEPSRQLEVLKDVSRQIQAGNKSIIGLMLESNLQAGNQSIPENLSDLKYGVSITDACMNWQTTEQALLELRAELKSVLQNRLR